MTTGEVIAELEVLGTEQNRKVYARHGIKGPMSGVSFANVDKLAKRIKRDHDLALALWETGHHDARMVAVRVADPEQLAAKVADAWVRDCDNYVAAESLAGLVARSPVGLAREKAWRDRKGEWVASAGWNVTTRHAMDGVLDDAACRELIEQIARELPARPNRVRHEMNMALIAIGSRGSADLKKRVLALARALGPIEVDHGETGCTTPDIAAYIARTEKRRGS